MVETTINKDKTVITSITGGRSEPGSRKEIEKHSYEFKSMVRGLEMWTHIPVPVASGFYEFGPRKLLQQLSWRRSV